jgi:hypothetical protein
VFSWMMINSFFFLLTWNVSWLSRHCSVDVEGNGVWMEGVPQIMFRRCGGTECVLILT